MEEPTPAPAARDTRPLLERLAERLAGSRDPMHLVLSAAIVVVALIWMGLYYYLTFEKRAAYDAAAVLSGNYARIFEEHTVRTVQGIDQTVLFLKHEAETSRAKLNLEAYASQGLFLDKYFNLIALIDADGWVTTTHKPLPRSNVKDREHFQVHVTEDTRNLFISKPVLGRSSGKWSVQFTRRINAPDGRFGGIVVASLDPNYFSDFYKSVNLGDSSIAVLVGTDGIVRARRSGDVTDIGQNVSGGELFRNLKQSPYGSYVVTSLVDSTRRLYSYRKLENYPLVVLVGISEEEILSEYREHRRVLATLGAFITVLLIFSAYAIALVLQQQVRVQESLRRSEHEAVSANRMKSEFLARMSHELRTPLNGILGFAEYLKDNLKEPDHRMFAETMLQAGQHLLSLVNATLDLAKIEAGHMDVHLEIVDLPILLHRVTSIHQPELDKKKLDLIIDFSEDMPETLVCDATKLRQVVNNLLHNAIKFTNAGSITFRVEKARDLLFSVKDTGVGIPADMKDAVFEPFRQLDNFETRSQGGTGLGLALAKQLVELMGGRIWVESEPGKGTTFFFTLPLNLKLPEKELA